MAQVAKHWLAQKSETVEITMSEKHNETVKLVKERFPISDKANEVSALTVLYKSLRWDAFHGSVFAKERVDEIDKRFKELGLTD